MTDTGYGSGAGLQVPGRAAPATQEADRAHAWWLDAVRRGAGDAGARWLDEAIGAAHDARALTIAFGSAPRRVGRAPLAIDPAAPPPPPVAVLRPAPRIDEAARMLLAVARAEHDPDAPERLLRHADVGECRAVYRALSLFPPGTRLDDAVGRGLRTHAAPIFEAIAHGNPWPAANLDEHRWNHMVLKALFIDSALHPILGLDERANAALARMLLDFADERRAAGRPVPAELWRCALPFAPAARLTGHALPPDPSRAAAA